MQVKYGQLEYYDLNDSNCLFGKSPKVEAKVVLVEFYTTETREIPGFLSVSSSLLSHSPTSSCYSACREQEILSTLLLFL